MSTAKARAVFLVGFMGAGKTATGDALACRLGWRFVDLDAYIEAREGRSIAQIFANDGEAAFRRAESAALREIVEGLTNTAVVALGGGTFADPENSVAVQRAGTTVFLEASPDVLLQRVGTAGARPLVGSDQDFVGLYAKRIATYRSADVTVNTENKSAAAVAAEIATRLGLE